MYLQVKASSLDLQMPTRGRVAPKLGRVPPIRQTNSSLKSSTKCFRTPQIGIGLTYILPMVFFAFMFHFYVSTY